MITLLNPEESLSKEDIADLVEENKEFDKWLKRVKKISNYPHARFDREKRREKLREIIKKTPQPPITLKRIVETIELYIEQEDQVDIIQDIKEFFRDNLGVEVKFKEIEIGKRAEERPIVTEREKLLSGRIIGRVAPTIRTPATPTEFWFWLEDDDSIRIETGSLITARSKTGIRITGLVSEIQSITDIDGVLDSYYAHSLGKPEEEMPTKLPSIVSAKVEVIRRSDGRNEPVKGMWPVFSATAKEIREAYGAEISPEHEILAGFTYDGDYSPVPVGIDSRYVMGYEAAHINISGASGVATKTSFALFLIYSLLSSNNRILIDKDQNSVAAIAFNVKEADLMFIDYLPEDWRSFDQWINHARLGHSIKLWKQAKEDYGLDPINWKKKNKIKFFAPMHFRPEGGVLSQRKENVTPFNYSLQSIISLGAGSLYTLFDPEDLDEKALALLASLSDEARIGGDFTFETVIRKMKNSVQTGQSEWIKFGQSYHHRATAIKILNRLNHALDNQLKGIILKSENTDNPIPIASLRPGYLWVIDITQLRDKGQRLVFQTLVRSIFNKLETRKSLEITGQLKGELAKFPKHVVIFVDELNKFVPAGKQFSAVKGDIIEMAARGRSVGLSLIGAQQLASKVDEEVLANTSTFAVGRSHAVEIKKASYGWLPKGLQEKAMILEKGRMLLWHCLHKRPVLLHFPLPLHKIYEEIERGQYGTSG